MANRISSTAQLALARIAKVENDACYSKSARLIGRTTGVNRVACCSKATGIID